MKLKVYLLHKDAIIPSYAHHDDSAMDLSSVEEVLISPGHHLAIETGIAIQLPPLTEAQIRPRSGLAYKHGITVLNTPGTIDEGYTGELKVILINHGPEVFQVLKGMRIAQMAITPVIRPEILPQLGS
ncbi:dUTP diphosphatase [Laspinema olomoucense]|uniref:dUTP diphosphatase n=1 Tax=Laspinema olomoucense TaxID=3231600 RepID=UPI0021BB0A05|nr:dUTP diphosphatase [Laspinema sp. D3d]MCT7971284.1 dUTP diphosphatase [Laspinema sp. D3d]